MMTIPDDKKSGFSHLIAAMFYSFGGLRRVLAESAFRHELILAVGTLSLLGACRVSLQNMVISIVLLLILLAVEAINTAIEEIIDRISPELSVTGKHAKDLGSFAVFCMITAVLAHAAFALYSVFGA